jgi:putative ABC transport system permease protein
MFLLRLAAKSLLNRKITTGLTLFSVVVSVTLLLMVERIGTGALKGFQSMISGTDLIVGARAGAIPLLLFSIFGIGTPEQNMSWASYENLSKHPEVKEAVPISLGDSHRGFRVIATTSQYFVFYRYADEIPLSFQEGSAFRNIYDAVIGAEVARELQYRTKKEIYLTHGESEASFQDHKDHPFRITGILQPTGTPVDRSLFIPIQAMELLHKKQGQVRQLPQMISAVFLRLRSKTSVLQLQREINNYSPEALTAIVPGRTLQELWRFVSVLENAFFAISIVTFILSLSGIILVFVTTLNERKREMAILRSVGARPWFIATMLLCEAGVLAAVACILSLALVITSFVFIGPMIVTKLGMDLSLAEFQKSDIFFLILAFAGALMASLVPALSVYRSSISEGLTVRL